MFPFNGVRLRSDGAASIRPFAVASQTVPVTVTGCGAHPAANAATHQRARSRSLFMRKYKAVWLYKVRIFFSYRKQKRPDSPFIRNPALFSGGKPSYFFGVVEPQVVLLFFVEFVVVDLVASVADGLVACPFIVFLSSFITVKFNWLLIIFTHVECG